MMYHKIISPPKYMQPAVETVDKSPAGDIIFQYKSWEWKGGSMKYKITEAMYDGSTYIYTQSIYRDTAQFTLDMNCYLTIPDDTPVSVHNGIHPVYGVVTNRKWVWTDDELTRHAASEIISKGERIGIHYVQSAYVPILRDHLLWGPGNKPPR